MPGDFLRSKNAPSLPRPVEASGAAAELERAQQQLKKLNLWFDIVLNNMVRGLAIFDADQRLIVCNRRYGEICGVPERLTRPGTPYASIARHLRLKTTGRDDSEENERESNWIEGHMSKLARGEAISYTQHLKGGRTVHVTSQPITDGGWVEIQESVAERREEEQTINWLAHNDPLTEVANTMCFEEEMENALRQMKLGTTFALHWIDLDRFGEINDTFGHPIGDAVLRSVAERLVQSVREHDLVARLGGDEFAVIQAGVKTQSDAKRFAKRLLRAISEPCRALGHEMSISASIGVVLAPENGTTSLELIKNAYLALYAAKTAGRNTLIVFEEGRADVPNERREVAPVRTSALPNG